MKELVALIRGVESYMIFLWLLLIAVVTTSVFIIYNLVSTPVKEPPPRSAPKHKGIDPQVLEDTLQAVIEQINGVNERRMKYEIASIHDHYKDSLRQRRQDYADKIADTVSALRREYFFARSNSIDSVVSAERRKSKKRIAIVRDSARRDKAEALARVSSALDYEQNVMSRRLVERILRVYINQLDSHLNEQKEAQPPQRRALLSGHLLQIFNSIHLTYRALGILLLFVIGGQLLERAQQQR